jgi:chromosomal replication initiation ATPase DnaA
MEQLIFKFPFSKKYFEQDFFVSSNNFSAFKLIEEWPTWPGKWLNIFGESGSGKTHLAKILEKKINNTKLIDAKDIDNEVVQEMVNFDCLIIDSFKNDIDEKLLYSILNQSKRFENYVLIISTLSIKEKKFKLNDLQSRMNSFLYFGIELPTDDLLKIIISKTLSEKQININPKILDFILNNVERSYDKMFKFLKDLDELSLSTGKSININLIKKALNQ